MRHNTTGRRRMVAVYLPTRYTLATSPPGRRRRRGERTSALRAIRRPVPA